MTATARKRVEERVNKPQRIQRKRTKGWKMPPNTVYVGRPTRWGNPYSVELYGLDDSLKLFRETLFGFWSPNNIKGFSDALADLTYELHCEFRNRFRVHPIDVISELRGINLSCWCPLDQPCHADVLLEIANGE